MSNLLKEIMEFVGVEFLSGDNKEEFEQINPIIESVEAMVFPDFDHVTVI